LLGEKGERKGERGKGKGKERDVQSVNITSKVFTSEIILQDLLPTQIILALQTGAVLRHVDDGLAVARRDPDEQLVEPVGVGAQPKGLRFGSDRFALFVLEERLEVAEVIVRVLFRGRWLWLV